MEVAHRRQRIALQVGCTPSCKAYLSLGFTRNCRVDTTAFASQVRKYNELPPFNFKGGNFSIFNKQFNIHISIYAAHLYDSVVLYARALDILIREKKAAGEQVNIYQLARDGSCYRDSYLNSLS